MDELTEIKELKKGEIVFKTQDPANHLFLVKSGQILCFRREHQRIYPIGMYEEGGIFGEDSVLAGKFYQYFAICMEDTTLVPVGRKDFETYLNSTNKWVGKLSGVLAKRVAESQALISEHKVVHETITRGDEFTPEQESFIFNSLKKINV